MPRRPNHRGEDTMTMADATHSTSDRPAAGAELAPPNKATCALAGGDPDAELLRRCAAFEKQHLHYIELCGGENPADDATCLAALDDWLELLSAVRATPATTLEGLKAKAATYQPASRVLTGDAPQEFETLTEMACARSLVVDILRLRG
jgi:hypothetical protein